MSAVTGTLTARAMLDSTRAVPESQRVDEAFGSLQDYKGHEDMVVGGVAPTAPNLRRIGLRDGDVFLDLYWSTEDSTLVVFTLPRTGRSQARVFASHDIGPDARVRDVYADREGLAREARRAHARAVLKGIFGLNVPPAPRNDLLGVFVPDITRVDLTIAPTPLAAQSRHYPHPVSAEPALPVLGSSWCCAHRPQVSIGRRAGTRSP